MGEGKEVKDAGDSVVCDGVDLAVITSFVRLRTAPSIMHKIIIPVLYCTWQYTPFGRPSTIKYAHVYNDYCIQILISFTSLKRKKRNGKS